MRKKPSPPQVGKLPPRYRFILNPYAETHFSTCPSCNGKTLIRKVPLFIHVQPHYPTTINKHRRYCPKCDILIAYQDELEHTLVLTYEKRQPEMIGNEYTELRDTMRAASGCMFSGAVTDRDCTCRFYGR